MYLALPLATHSPRGGFPRSLRPASLAALIGIATAAILVSAGCGGPPDGRLETHPVSGQVIINGEPAEGCIVAFVPLDAELKGEVMPGGTTDTEGRFQLTTYETGDGAPAGEYGVTLRWEAKDWLGREAEMAVDPVEPVGPDRLQEQFASPEKSGLQVTVSEGANQLEPFRLENVELLAGSK